VIARLPLKRSRAKATFSGVIPRVGGHPYVIPASASGRGERTGERINRMIVEYWIARLKRGDDGFLVDQRE